MSSLIIRGGEYARRGLPNRKVEDLIIGADSVAYLDENRHVAIVQHDGMRCGSPNPYDLIPYVAPPPRFSLTADGCGILDSENPGMVAAYLLTDNINAQNAVRLLNEGKRRPSSFTWTPITRMVPYTRETWPGDVWIRYTDEWDAFCVDEIGDNGIKTSRGVYLTWQNLFGECLWSNTHKKSGPWHRCETEERS